MFCNECGKEINDKAVVCIHCGCAVGNKEQNSNTNNQGNITVVNSNVIGGSGARNRSWLACLILCFIGGWCGLHRFYTGYPGIGILQLVSFGGFFIWWAIDFIAILLHVYECGDGGKLV